MPPILTIRAPKILVLANISSLVIARLLGSLMQASIILLFVKHLSIAQFGSYSGVIGLGAVLTGIFGLGASVAALRIESCAGLGNANALIVIGLLGSIPTALISLSYATYFTSATIACALAAAAYVCAEMINGICQNILFGRRQNKTAEAFLVLRRAVPLAGLAIGSYWGHDTEIFSLFLVGNAITIATGLAAAWDPNPSSLNLRKTINGVRHYWGATVAAMLQQLDVVIINATLGEAVTAIYAAAFRLASPVHIVTNSLVSLLLPKLKDSHPESRNREAKPYLHIGLAYAGVVVGFSPFCALLIGRFFGPQYGAHWIVFTLLLINSAVSVINQLTSARLYGDGQERSVFHLTAAATIVGLCLVYLAATLHSIDAVALGTVLNQVILLLSLRTIKKRAR